MSATLIQRSPTSSIKSLNTWFTFSIRSSFNGNVGFFMTRCIGQARHAVCHEAVSCCGSASICGPSVVELEVVLAQGSEHERDLQGRSPILRYPAWRNQITLYRLGTVNMER